MKIKLIRASMSVPIEVEIEKGLEGYRRLVNGYIEFIALKTGETMIVNEDGILLKLPYNPVASKLAERMIVGDVFILKKDETL